MREAIAFLTVLPAGGGRLGPRAAPWFALVGAAVGALVGGAALGLAELMPPLLAGALAVALELAITGALHADGLADSADGLGGRDRDRALAIMRDHALGAYGASALVLDLLVKSAALGALAQAGELLPVVAAFALSRAAALPLAAVLPYARPGEGTGRALDGLTLRVAALGAVPALALAAFAGAYAAVAVALVVTAGVGALAHRRLGGVTGDVMGAAIELTATAALVTAVAG
ncbi:MAG TPA: adenosylcobinamide-GDP ribazoletransferase [Solirubrobacteraceae bacterium]|nr:adenosylcobinamide-GDP ribazoletransferase [Solirubrobacteraceae bacterium]